MNADELMKVSDGLGWIVERLNELPEDKKDAVEASLYCSAARLVVMELVHHLVSGVEPYEALRRTAVGELNLCESQKTLWKVFTAKPTE